jgi:thiol-disulfide isomerase/thioredoxin
MDVVVVSDVQEVETFKRSVAGVKLIQFTATWCKRCEVLQEEVAAYVAEQADVSWLVAPLEVEGVEETYAVAQMPRIDVLGGRGDPVVLSGARATLENARVAVEEARVPPLELDADF